MRLNGSRAEDVAPICVASSSLNCPTRLWSCIAISASSLAAFCDSCALDEVPRAASATPSMWCVISLDPLAASLMLRVISLVVALCSSTAVAMVAEMSLIWLMTPLTAAMASTAL